MATIPGPRAVAITLTGLILVGITAWYILILLRDPPPPPPRCDPGLQEEGPECVGVSDVSDFGDPLLADVMAKIAAANSKVSRVYLTVNVFVPTDICRAPACNDIVRRATTHGARLVGSSAANF